MQQRYPSAMRIRAEMLLSYEQAGAVRRIMEHGVQHAHLTHYPDTYEWVHGCARRPAEHAIALSAINELIEGVGCEAVFDRAYSETLPVAEYVNVGDPDLPTIMFLDGKWKLARPIDVIEGARRGAFAA